MGLPGLWDNARKSFYAHGHDTTGFCGCSFYGFISNRPLLLLVTEKETRAMTLIYDMRNFTPLTSTMLDGDAQAVFINLHYQMTIGQVFEAGGEVDKLMGDAVMALFPDGRKALDAAMKCG